ncbi:AraC family transcriptional regulator [Ureibacillus massiliensis 4400831 = CIP 108448 = CCUG 49529]|uniref:AraC family transcriptional regulator n=1 Tax=Ureibacillus massiliensis 4400831 = CIP 108448 = CCUG 49529 TaxID=1211035 RepID=A0A0A3JXK2_9BACL|nr:AraC family transcriptional regulator [Ureibacillus massiliensis]KGR91732.1 AraC family transcriptional regulator [Ureibacillus massiliensis 4400831 = CIP 108448 = CCUG 49529]RKJ57516.1 AraC family transcriptional regulator [Butyricicoccus sp. 1XD8-22]
MDGLNQVICEKRSYSKEFKSHQHEFGQFLFPLQGSLELQTKWQEINLDPDHCLYIPPKCDHNYRSVDRNEFLILDIPSQYLPEDTSNMYIQVDEQWASIRYLLLEESRNKASTAALVDLTRYVTNKLQISNPPSIEYIHKHFREPITLETLANIEHYHPVYYSSWFKKQTGKSPKVYINELRLKEAKHLLISTEWSISKISEEVGFMNSSSFTRWFVNCEGITPQKYRVLNNR